jgi:DNA-binding transcriptional regulator YiaG
MTTPIEQLAEMIRERFPQADLSLDAPKNQKASWWMDVRVGNQSLAVEWRPAKGFGISARPDAAYGELSDETHETANAAFGRIDQLILSGVKTAEPMTLSELRRHREVSQVELARRLAIQQATISKMERRPDVMVGTLKNMVSALGGQLEIHARFPDEVVRIQLENPDEQSH